MAGRVSVSMVGTYAVGVALEVWVVVVSVAMFV